MQSTLEILSEISDTFSGHLSVEKYGLVMLHNFGMVRWIEMDRQTCALIFNIYADKNLSFQLDGKISDRFFHSLLLQTGNVVFSGFAHEGNLNVMPNESLYFHNRERHLRVEIKRRKQCKLVLFSQSLTDNGYNLLKEKRTDNMELSVLEKNCCTFLNRIFKAGINPKSFIELKGLLFLVLGAAMPKGYLDISRTAMSHGNQ